MERRYYWIKLHTEFFSEDKIDFLMSQENGAEYVVLYQMLCLKTANNKGYLSSKVGEVIVKYDVDKIVRDCKYFERDTVIVALELYKRLGLIFEEIENVFRIADFDNLIGTEGKSAKRVREYRQRQREKALQCNKNVTQNQLRNLTQNSEKMEEMGKRKCYIITESYNVTQEIEKEIEKEKDTDLEKNIKERDIREKSSLSQKKFYETFKNKKQDEPFNPSFEVDIDLLTKSIQESDFLNSANNLGWKWCCKHYFEIVNGNYKNYKKQDPDIIHDRKYSQEDIKGLVVDIDKIEI